MFVVSLVSEPLPKLPGKQVETYEYVDMHGETVQFQTGDTFTFGYARDPKTQELVNWGTECFALIGLSKTTVQTVRAVTRPNGQTVSEKHVEPHFDCQLVQAYQHRVSPTCNTREVIPIAASVLAGNRKFTRTLPADPAELRKARHVLNIGRS